MSCSTKNHAKLSSFLPRFLASPGVVSISCPVKISAAEEEAAANVAGFFSKFFVRGRPFFAGSTRSSSPKDRSASCFFI